MNTPKELLNKMPAVKKILKQTFKGVLDAQEQKRIKAYNAWIRQYDLTERELAQQKKDAEELAYKPLISIIAPTYNTPEHFFKDMTDSVLNQTYDNWELILVDDASPQPRVRELIDEYSKRDQRVKKLFLKKNLHIAGATNEAMKIAAGEFISLFDHDDILRPNALFEVVKALNKNKKLDFIYTDEDKIIDGLDSRRDPFFKPGWNQDFLYSVNYITHFTTIRKKVLDKTGYEDGNYNGAQDWELFLRITRSIPAENIHHIPKILYNWRIHDASTAKSFAAKPYVVESQRKSIESDFVARGYTNASIAQDRTYPGQWNATFKLHGEPRVVVVTKTDKSAEHIKATTDYSNYEVVVKETVEFKELINTIKADFIVRVEGGSLINRDTTWLRQLIGDAARKDIGIVVVRHKRGVVADNLRALLDDTILEFATKLSSKDLTMHLYETTRYNLPYVVSGTIAVETKKIRQVLADRQESPGLKEVSEALATKGYRNLYNPCVKMVK